MNNKKEKMVFWIIGLGCGVLLSGIVGAFVSLNILNKEIVLTSREIQTNNLDAKKQEVKNFLNEEEIIRKALSLGMKFEEINTIKDEENNFIQVYISSELGATEICELLEKNKVIVDANKFRQYIEKHDKLTSLRHGEFKFPRNIVDEEVLSILLDEK